MALPLVQPRWQHFEPRQLRALVIHEAVDLLTQLRQHTPVRDLQSLTSHIAAPQPLVSAQGGPVWYEHIDIDNNLKHAVDAAAEAALAARLLPMHSHADQMHGPLKRTMRGLGQPAAAPLHVHMRTLGQGVCSAQQLTPLNSLFRTLHRYPSWAHEHACAWSPGQPLAAMMFRCQHPVQTCLTTLQYCGACVMRHM